MASATTPAPAPAASTPPVVVVSQNVLPQTLSYLQGRGLQVHSVPAQERLSAQNYNALHERISGAHGLLAFPGDTVDGDLVKQAGPQFVAVSVAGRAGSVDVAACTAAGVVVSATSPDLEAPFVTELAVAQCLALLRHLREVDAHTRADAAGGDAYVPPVRSPAPGGSLVGATVGLLGVTGALPLAISRALIALGVTTILCLPVGSTNVTGDVDAVVSAVNQAALPGQSPAPTVVLVSALPELLKSSDVVFMTTHDVTRRTRHVIDSAALATVKRGLLLINAASGALIDEGAVAQALESGVLGGYACGGLARDERGLRSVGVDYGGPFPAATHAALLASPHALLAASGTATAVLAAAQRVELEAARALAEALDGRVPSGAVNPTVPPRRPGAPPTSEVARAGGLASYLWCF